ncbi:FAD-dependent monooxygenase [Streptosporangium sp. CA-135522]|uniref:FAD-dependent monooxygenase n=1 Tax=Streptosporangium sp. CA-135522 TaxID=3240072 RepID=UPI003D8C458F
MKIAIVGGGLGGLAAALLLRQAGIEATVYEQAAVLREVGAGIVVAPNMVRPLVRAGLGERLAEFAVTLEAAWEFRRWEDGRVLFSQPMGQECRRLYGADCYVAHRADLLAMLLEALPEDAVRLDRRLTGLRQDDRQVELTFAGARGESTTVLADAVVGADGIHSTVRPSIAAEAPARFSGLCAYRCLVPAHEAPDLALRPVQSLWLGPGRHFVHYPISGGRLVNVVAIVPAGDWRIESWTADGRIEDLAREFETWDPRLGQLIASATGTKRWALYDRSPLERWTDGRVTLLGDAAHAMLPFFGQGACQAVEDAAVLAACLRTAAPETAAQALLRYEGIRRPRASQVQLMSRGREVHNHLPDGPAQRERDAAFADGDPLRQNAWIYGHDPDTEPVG